MDDPNKYKSDADGIWGNADTARWQKTPTHFCPECGADLSEDPHFEECPMVERWKREKEANDARWEAAYWENVDRELREEAYRRADAEDNEPEDFLPDDIPW